MGGIPRDNNKRIISITQELSEPDWVQPHKFTGIHFRKAGKMVGSTSFGHLVFDFNLTLVEGHIDQVCLYPQLMINLSSFKEKERNSTLETTIMGYHRSLQTRCDLLRDLYEGTKLLWYNEHHDRFIRSVWRPPLRTKRQLILAGLVLSAGVMAATSYIFTQAQVCQLSAEASDPDSDTKKILQINSDRLQVNEAVLHEMNSTLHSLLIRSRDHEDMLEAVRFFTRLDSTTSILQWEMQRLVTGLETLTEHHLSPQLINAKELAGGIIDLQTRMSRVGLTPLLHGIEDAYHCDTSHVMFTNGTLRVFLHIPAYQDDSLLDLYRLVPMPLVIPTDNLVHSSIDPDVPFFYPEPEPTILAVSPSHNLFRAMKEDEFALCRQIGNVHYCQNNNYYDRRLRRSCLVSMFLNEGETMVKTCKFNAKEHQDFLLQTSSNEFVLYQIEPSSVELRCAPRNYSSSAFRGIRRIIVNPGCRATSKNFIFDGAISIYMDPDQIVTHFSDLEPHLLKVLPPSHEIADLIKTLDAAGDRSAMTFEQLTSKYWTHKRSRFISISVLVLLIIACLLVWACALYLICPALGNRFAWCGKALDTCLPCFRHRYRLAVARRDPNADDHEMYNDRNWEGSDGDLMRAVNEQQGVGLSRGDQLARLADLDFAQRAAAALRAAGASSAAGANEATT